jgi:excisionase family DNA binding protein
MTRSKAPHASAKVAFYTVKEVAEMLAVSPRTVRRRIKNAKLVAHVFGGAVRIAEADLKAFIATHRDA